MKMREKERRSRLVWNPNFRSGKEVNKRGKFICDSLKVSLELCEYFDLELASQALIGSRNASDWIPIIGVINS